MSDIIVNKECCHSWSNSYINNLPGIYIEKCSYCDAVKFDIEEIMNSISNEVGVLRDRISNLETENIDLKEKVIEMSKRVVWGDSKNGIAV